LSPGTIPAHIQSVAHHDSGVRRITLTLHGPFRHRAGQYLNIVHPGGVRIPLSIASAPHRLPRLELHYRPLPGVADAVLMDELLAQAAQGHGDVVQIDGPHGNVAIEGPTPNELLLIAGGSGIAQCCCICEHLRSVAQIEPVRLVWAVTEPRQLYCDSELRTPSPWLWYLPLIDVPGRANAAVEWLRQMDTPLRGRVVVSGGPGFVYAIDDALKAIGTADATVESDVFSYAPRR
jgi:CDP-4-dehydro-6-deoxyglucose reductase, E3